MNRLIIQNKFHIILKVVNTNGRVKLVHKLDKSNSDNANFYTGFDYSIINKQ